MPSVIQPQRRRQLRDLVDCWATYAAEKRVEIFLHEKAEGGHHADAAMSELRLPKAVNLTLRQTFSEASWIEIRERGG